MENQQPEALILANDRPSAIGDDLYQWALDAEGMIRRQHARIAELEAHVRKRNNDMQAFAAEVARLANQKYADYMQ